MCIVYIGKMHASVHEEIMRPSQRNERKIWLSGSYLGTCVHAMLSSYAGQPNDCLQGCVRAAARHRPQPAQYIISLATVGCMHAASLSQPAVVGCTASAIRLASIWLPVMKTAPQSMNSTRSVWSAYALVGGTVVE